MIFYLYYSYLINAGKGTLNVISLPSGQNKRAVSPSDGQCPYYFDKTGFILLCFETKNACKKELHVQ